MSNHDNLKGHVVLFNMLISCVFQLLEWITTLRLAGKIPPGPSPTPAFCKLLEELGVQNHTKPSDKVVGKVFISKTEAQSVAKTLSEMGTPCETRLVHRDAECVSGVSEQRGLRTIKWSTEAEDKSKTTYSHNVCWTNQ